MAETAEGVDYSSLKESLFKNLEQRGVVEKLKAIVRSELYDEINDTVSYRTNIHFRHSWKTSRP
jgi:hypothetical protein